MRDSVRENSEAFEALHVSKVVVEASMFFLCRALVRDVACGANHADFPIGSGLCLHDGVEPADFSFGGEQSVLALKNLLAGVLSTLKKSLELLFYR